MSKVIAIPNVGRLANYNELSGKYLGEMYQEV